MDKTKLSTTKKTDFSSSGDNKEASENKDVTEKASCLLEQDDNKEENIPIKIESAKKYFIAKVGEYFKNKDYSLQTNRTDSLRNIFQEIIELNEEMNRKNTDKDRLKTSMKYLMEGLLFTFKNNPLFKHQKIERDISYLISKLDTNLKKDHQNEKEKESKKNKQNNKQNNVQDDDKTNFDDSIFNAITSLNKRFESVSILELHIEIIEGQKQPLSYREVDELLNSFVSELIYEGFSLKYLDDWFIKNIQKRITYNKLATDQEVTETLDLFKKFDKSRREFEIVFSLTLPKEVYNQATDQQQIKIVNKYTYIKDKEKIYDEIQKNLEMFELDNDEITQQMKIIRKYMPISKANTLFIKASIKAFDKYKAVELLQQPIENYLQIYKLKNSSSNIGCGSRAIYLKPQKKWEMLDTSSISLNMLQKNYSKREKEDINDFIILREELKQKDIVSNEIFILERAFGLINSLSSNISLENRLLNLWSALEYILIPFPKKSIIEKARQIIPKVISLYTVKDKMNILWDNLQTSNGTEEVKSLLSSCISTEKVSSDKIKKYDKDKFANLLKNKTTATILHNSFNSSILRRQIAELNGLLNKQKELKEVMRLNSKIINHDLNRIYRVRNKLVHSGRNIPQNIEIITGRLFRYVSCLIGTLIHYLDRSPHLTIEEILHSIVATYDWYLSEDLAQLEINDLVTPPYLYL
ncbi:hypothetical protein [Priestia aryabhattai]|uniref:hypothetical protein n=1 Tax=Priestia aryabhattai TaxID=412384 RepID=UPI00265B199D|nr:hypothetical protein [Priestia aryabhattai]WKG33400.1 hypothetical protein QYS54_27295 [Priestia aryabhattai]